MIIPNEKFTRATDGEITVLNLIEIGKEIGNNLLENEKIFTDEFENLIMEYLVDDVEIIINKIYEVIEKNGMDDKIVEMR